jgi:hypothetical protein
MRNVDFAEITKNIRVTTIFKPFGLLNGPMNTYLLCGLYHQFCQTCRKND